MARKEKAAAAAPPVPPANASKELVSQYQALVVSLNTLANAAQTASYAAGQYMTAAFPGVDIGAGAFFQFAGGPAPVAAAATAAHDEEEDGNPAKRRKRSKNTTPKDPNAPKKPLTAYFAFAKVARPEVVSELPGASNKEITEELAAKWASMKDTGEQQPFRDQYAIEMKSYTKQIEQYKKNLGGAATLPSDAVEPEEEEEEEPAPPPPKPVTPKSTSKSKKEKEKEKESTASSKKKGKDKAAPKEKSRKRSAAAAKETNTPPASNGEEEQPAPATKSPRKRKRKTAD